MHACVPCRLQLTAGARWDHLSATAVVYHGTLHRKFPLKTFKLLSSSALPCLAASTDRLCSMPLTPYSSKLQFLIMGGAENTVDLRLLGSGEECQSLATDLIAFDVRAGKCTVQEDEDRMLAAIAGAFGDLNTFSASLAQILGSILRRGDALKSSRSVVPGTK